MKKRFKQAVGDGFGSLAIELQQARSKWQPVAPRTPFDMSPFGASLPKTPELSEESDKE